MGRSIRDRLQNAWWGRPATVGGLWRRITEAPPRSWIVGAVAVVAVAALVAGVTMAVRGGASGDGEPSPARLAVATNADLPANLWSGWVEEPLAVAPAVAHPDPEISAVPDQCQPGGQLQQEVQKLGVEGRPWAGSTFTNIAVAAKATAMIAGNELNLVKAVDAWSAACGESTVTRGDQKLTVTVKQHPVKPSSYRLKAARVVAQTVTRQIANAQPESTTLTAVGRSGHYISYVTLTFPGEVNADALTTLDTLWRAQAAKLVAYQQAGEL